MTELQTTINKALLDADRASEAVGLAKRLLDGYRAILAQLDRMEVLDPRKVDQLCGDDTNAKEMIAYVCRCSA